MKQLGVLLCAILSFTACSQAVTLSLDASGQLQVTAEDGSLEPLALPQGEVRRAITADGINFRLSFGRDTSGLLIAILEPADTDAITATVKVQSSKPVSIASVEAGIIGKIRVNDRTVPPGMRKTLDGSQAVSSSVTIEKDSVATIYFRGITVSSALNKPVEARPADALVEYVDSL